MKFRHIYISILCMFTSCRQNPERIQGINDSVPIIKKNIIQQKLPENKILVPVHKTDSIPEILDSQTSYLIKDTIIETYHIWFINKVFSIAAGGTNALRIAVLQDERIVLDSILETTYGGDLEYSLFLEKITYTGHSFLLHEELTDAEKGVENQQRTKELTFEANFSKLHLQP